MSKLSRRQNDIIKNLANVTGYIGGDEIASRLNISVRTLRNEITAIRKIHGEGIVVTLMGKGYSIGEGFDITKILNVSGEQLLKRQLVILKDILFNKDVNFYDLADSHFISESTLEKDIRSLNTIISEKFEDVKIERENNALFLDVDETKKREITSYFLANEIKNFDFDFKNYTGYFKNFDIVMLKKYVLEFLEENEIQVRDIALVSLVLHIGIMIDRILEDESIESTITTNIDSYTKMQVDKLRLIIEKFIGRGLPDIEMYYLKSVFTSKITIQNSAEKNKEIEVFINEILSDIYSFYQVDFCSDDALKQSLYFHFVSLMQRAKHNKFLNNPLIEEIKENFPLIYDISVHISYLVQKKLNIVLHEEEIGYLSLHLMVAAEKLRTSNYVVLLINPYGDSSSKYIAHRIKSSLDLDIDVKYQSTFSSYDDLGTDIDLIVSTIALSKKCQVPIYKTSSIITSSEISKIKNILSRKKPVSNRKVDIKPYFSNDLFFPNLEYKDKDQLLKYLCDKLVEQNYVDENYIDYIIKRENIAPTAFGGLFAIPHPTEKIAKRTGIAVATLQNPIQWGTQKVSVVFMFSLSQDKTNITDIFELLDDLVDDNEKLEQLLEHSTFEKFIEELTI